MNLQPLCQILKKLCVRSVWCRCLTANWARFRCSAPPWPQKTERRLLLWPPLGSSTGRRTTVRIRTRTFTYTQIPPWYIGRATNFGLCHRCVWVGGGSAVLSKSQHTGRGGGCAGCHGHHDGVEEQQGGLVPLWQVTHSVSSPIISLKALKVSTLIYICHTCVFQRPI